MKLWKKLSMLVVVAILFATGIFGGTVVYQTANYNISQTISNYQRQVTSTTYAMEQEIRNNAPQEFGDEANKSFLKYALRKYGGSDYMLFRNGELASNLTNYDVTHHEAMPEWSVRQVAYIIQRRGREYILIMGKQFSASGSGVYDLVLVRDISKIYGDIMHQLWLLLAIYAGVTAVTINIIFWVTRHLLRPLNELQWTAASISAGDLGRRVRVRKNDEVGRVAEAFNKMADQVERQVEELEEVSERRKQLLGSLTHELKTPMTSIIGYSDTLLHVKISEQQQRKALEYINSECKRLERLSGKMMHLIGLYNNESVHFEEFEVQELLNRVAELEKYHVQEQGMQLIMTCTMGRIPMDVDLMESLLVNLIDNAIKASREGDTIDVLAMHDRITIRDWGKGIPPEEIPKITEAFYMVDKSRSRKAGGIGLGLALCKQIAALHHGHLEIESWLDDGTSVSVVFDGWKGNGS
ncbi:MAG: HAMP domain-containing sensor histidine kinase [Lachnospiraceae bacterium]|nr:HAMP domain-containing sensor histidine kinase [Lachnospiraceae bacterium]